MSTSISDAMLDELQQKSRVYPVFEVTINSTIYRFASEPIASESQGRYEPFVQNWGAIERAIGDFPDYSLQFPKTSVSVYDKDRVIQKLVGGPGSGGIIGSVAQIILRSDHVASANHYTLFDGIIKDYRLSGDHLWQFVIGADDRELRADSNNIQTMTRTGWYSRLPEQSIGLDGQIVYGEHSSAGIEDATGLVECPLFYDPDTLDRTYWLVSVGKVEEVTNVWRSGELATSDFYLTGFFYLNGGVYSVIYDDEGTSTADDTITVDVKGVIDNSGGSFSSGDLIEDPIDILKHFLVNFVFGAYPTDSTVYQWLSSTGKPINTTYFDEANTFLTNRGHKCAKVIKSSDSPISILNEFCKSYKLSPFWTADWELAVRAFNPAPATVYFDSAHISQVDHKILSELVSETDSAKVISGIDGSYLYQDSSGGYAFQTRVEDPDRTTSITSDTLAFGKAKVA